MSCTIIISNLPRTCTSYEISALFGEIGAIKRCFLVKDEHKELTGKAQVTYRDGDSATTAAQRHNNTVFKERTITVESLLPPAAQHQTITHKRCRDDNDQEQISNETTEHQSKKHKKEIQETKPLIKQEELYHKDQPGRLIIRNVAFKATKDDVHNYFSKYGSITDINFPKMNRTRNNLKGCVFVEFSEPDAAAAAKSECNLQEFMGRHIVVDDALPKGKYQQAIQPKVEEVKQEPVVEHNIVNNTLDSMDTEDINQESSDSNSDEDEIEEISNGQVKKESGVVEPTKLVTNLEIKREKQEHFDPKDYQHKSVSRDVEEGRTMFISRLAIDTTASSVEAVLSNFGELKYVMLVKDKMTEQSKGTAFAQFKSRESADACLSVAEDSSKQDEVMVDGRVMEIRRACSRTSTDKPEETHKGKDNRNLYLAKEGFIREGTKAAADVSVFDISLRRQREKVKQNLLSNLHMFVSPTRLCVNNLPPSLKDPQLRQLFKKHAPPKARVTESRVMRYLNDLDEKGVARSRCYGFVAFSRHEDAIDALRTINNNPKIFTPNRRPIIEFSIENRSIVNKKIKRQQNSKPNKGPKAAETKESVTVNNNKKSSTEAVTIKSGDSSRPAFSGFTAKKGDIKPGSKIHKHLHNKVRQRDGSGGGAKGKGSSKGRPGSQRKTAKTKSAKKGKSGAGKKKVKKYTKI